MRTIKFRAWDSSSDEMLEDICTNTDDFTDMLNKTFEYWKEDSLILMQFTGLHDKNGKEIYEGDLCKVIARNSPRLEERAGLIFEVKDLLTMWRNFDDWIIEAPAECIEVIGNIHENPELLSA